jgi:hypothetical protein
MTDFTRMLFGAPKKKDNIDNNTAESTLQHQRLNIALLNSNKEKLLLKASQLKRENEKKNMDELRRIMREVNQLKTKIKQHQNNIDLLTKSKNNVDELKTHKMMKEQLEYFNQEAKKIKSELGELDSIENTLDEHNDIQQDIEEIQGVMSTSNNTPIINEDEQFNDFLKEITDDNSVSTKEDTNTFDKIFPQIKVTPEKIEKMYDDDDDLLELPPVYKPGLNVDYKIRKNDVDYTKLLF